MAIEIPLTVGAYTAYATNDRALWWMQEEELQGERWRYMLAHVLDLEEQQFASRERDLRHGQAYDETTTLMGTQMELKGGNAMSAPPIENLIASGVETMVAHLTRDNDRLAVITDGGDFEIQESAKAVEKVIAAEFRRLGVYRHRSLQARAGGVFGVGWVKFYELDNRPALDQVLKDEVVYDEEEARYYYPRSLFQRKFVDRWVAIHLFAKGPRKDEIRRAILDANPDGSYCSYRKCGRHQVAIIEGTRLPSGPGAGDGRRTISVHGCDLVDVPWTREYHPLVPWEWTPRLTGFGGRGIAEMGLPVQNRVNRHDRFIAVAQDRVAIPRVYLPKGAGIEVQMDNRVGALVKTPGGKPTFETPQAVSPEIYSDRREKRITFYEALGISQMMARGARPPGVDTEPAMREYREQTNERHSLQGKTLSDLLVTYGDRILDIIEDVYSRTGTYKATYISEDTREEIDWKQVGMARDRYSLMTQPANGLSREVSGLRQRAEEEYAAGTITLDEYRKVRGLPDVNAEVAIEGAITSLADATISGLIRDVPFGRIAPETSDDLAAILRRVRLKRADLKAHAAPHDMLDRFDRWIEQAEFAQGLAAVPQAAAPMMPAVPPEALAAAAPMPAMDPNAAPAAQMPAPLM